MKGKAICSNFSVFGCQLGHLVKFMGHTTLAAADYTNNASELVLFLAEISKSLFWQPKMHFS